MRQFQNGYSRRFNRARRRDGPLFRGRYRSRWIQTDAYWFNVVRYIDHNPVTARQARAPEQWAFGSAWHFHRGSTPVWLDRGPVESFVTDWSHAPFSAEAYAETFRHDPAVAVLAGAREPSGPDQPNQTSRGGRFAVSRPASSASPSRPRTTWSPSSTRHRPIDDSTRTGS